MVTRTTFHQAAGLGYPELSQASLSKPEGVGVIVCQCRVVTDRAVDAALADGARSVSAVCRSTGAAQDCGSCIFTVKALVCQHQEHERALLEVDGAAS
jgi:bacterioferritin-associated ferredoxin